MPLRWLSSIHLQRLAPTAYAVVVAMLLAACAGTPPRRAPTPTQLPPPPVNVAVIPDAVPRPEPRSAKGNPAFYDVFGRRYFVLATATGYVERGVASWYGPGFHAERTATGEAYDMYGMTAAHKTLPLPAYVQVTNLRNGRSVVVRVNDRGPFKDGRIIDLSYTAAAKLDILRDGTAFVEVRALTPGVETAPAAPVAPAGALFVQAGAFGSEANASRVLAQLRSQGFAKSFVRQDQLNGQTLYRVRIGPIPDVAEFDKVVAQLRKLGIADARLAAD
ncbi:MAG TPA: septal ring lytic transglycosylase RlpA family protein [Steroidobacteraceae bacterium]|jgi:rare lipoprotein A